MDCVIQVVYGSLICDLLYFPSTELVTEPNGVADSAQPDQGKDQETGEFQFQFMS